MSWFEATSFASLAKSAIKEAQKTIDKALDIREEERSQDSKDLGPPSPKVTEDLKEESENFFASFGLSSNTNEGVVSANKTEEESSHENAKTDEDSSGRRRVVESIWGSFTGSFFETPKDDDGKGTSQTTSAPATPSEKVVATQPPRSLSGLQESSKHLVASLLGSTSGLESPSSSITQISFESPSPHLENIIQSPFLEEVQEFAFGEEEVGGTRGWEWDSSIMVMSDDSKSKDIFSPTKSDLAAEENLADDTLDTEGFARSRLIVGTMTSASLDPELPQDNEMYSLPQQNVPLLRIPPSDKEPCLSSEEYMEHRNRKENPPEEQTETQQGLVESPDSIVLLDSSITSPVEHQDDCDSVYGLKHLSSAFSLDAKLMSPESLEGMDLTSPTSPSSIEIISRASTSDSSPTTIETVSTLSEDPFFTAKFKHSPSFSDPNEKENDNTQQTSLGHERTRKQSGEEMERQAITTQPISSTPRTIQSEDVSKNDQSLPLVNVDQTGGHLPEEAKESFHSSTTSSSTLTIVDVNEPVPEKVDCTTSESVCLTPEPSDEGGASVNAGDILKNLEKVDLQRTKGLTPCAEEATEVMREEDDSVPLEEVSSSSVVLEGPLGSSAALDMSSRSESSTETVTTSMDSQNMGWSDIVPHETKPGDDLETPPIPSEEFVPPLVGVQDMLEEAMGEDSPYTDTTVNVTLGESLPDGVAKENIPEDSERDLSPSSSDRSDALKVGSSGHSSADEVETATSSDIEVISSPSMDGSVNGNSRSSFGVPPSVSTKVWMSAQRSLRTLINEKGESSGNSHSSGSNHKRDNGAAYQGETVPSSMTTSFTSISESEGDVSSLPHSEFLQLEASRITQALLQDISSREKGHRRNISNLSETSESSSEPQTPEVEKLLRKITHLTDVLESRETKVLELSHMNSSLQDTNSSLKSRLEELEGIRKGSEANECLREEFTQRLVAMERKFQQALREKESIKKQLEEYKTEVASRRSSADVNRELEDKENLIVELRREGEKLSKQQLSYSNIVKKLRAKEKENETLIKEQRDKIESLSSDLERLRKQQKAKDEVERRQIDAIRQLTMATQRQEEEVKTLKADNSELEGKLSALKEALDSAYKEMNDLQRSAASKDAEAQRLSLSSEVFARQKVEMALAEAQTLNKKEQEVLVAQIRELQDSISQAESQSNRKERQLRGEIQDLLQRLSEAESRNDELSNSVSAATRPLLRQMENLQSTQAAQQAAWEGLEDSLNKRLHDAQNAAAASARKEREAKEQLAAIMTELSSLQSQVASLKAENDQTKLKLEMAEMKATNLEQGKSRDAQQLEALKSSFAEEIAEVKRERDSLEQQLDIEKTAVNAEKKKSGAYLEQLKERDKKLSQLQMLGNPVPNQTAAGGSHLSSPRSSPTPSLSRLSLSGSVSENAFWVHDDVFEGSWGSHRNLYDTLRVGSAVTVDALTSTLRQREGELHHLQSEVSRLEAQKESLALELVQSSRKCEEFLLRVQELEALKEAQNDTEQKYNALLQMYGEKVEEVEELQLDLEDVKELYKLQIDQLMQK